MARPRSVHKSISQTCVVFAEPPGFLSAMCVINRLKWVRSMKGELKGINMLAQTVPLGTGLKKRTLFKQN